MMPRFFEYVEEDWIAQKTLELVKVKSETLAEAEICSVYAKELESLGLEIFEREVSDSRFNIYGRLAGSGGPGSLIFNGHLDTIPIGDSWPPRIDESKVFGRGSEDMKGGLAALLAMVRAFKLSGTKLAGDLWIAAVVGHEDSAAAKDGPIAMCEDINEGVLKGDAIVIAEGDSELWTMSTGSGVFRILIKSKLGATHTNNITFEINPIRFVSRVIDSLYELQQRMDNGPSHPLCGKEKIDIGLVQAGDYYNRTPELSIIEGTIRWLPGKTEAEMRHLITDLVSPIAKAGNLEFSVDFLMSREPFEISMSEAVLQSALRSSEIAIGRKAKIIGKRVVGDANIFVAKTGIPSFYFGPGYQSAHSNNEWVSAESLVCATKFYGVLALDYLGESI
ncbi:MAG: M20 family metallopeptidase [Actinobacteria bacterium]|nr:M20 family metallopeptidase [Actinomycetota bacterium]